LLIISPTANIQAVVKIPLADTDAVFDALAHQSRRNILLILSHLGGELPSGYLATRFRHSWPTTTRHLGVLQKAGLVEVRREGRGSFYRVNRERLLQVVGGWLKYMEPVAPEKKWNSSGPKSTHALRSARPRRKGETQ
jgi:DNA-binding transcriptional ArsR family regulator